MSAHAATRIPGLLAPGKTAPAARQRSHEQALAILDDHYATGRPFALYFRTFSVGRLVGDDGHGGGSSYLQNVLLAALERVGLRLVMVQEPSESLDALKYPSRPLGQLLSPFVSETPAIRLADDRWTEGVTHLISRAELIMSELAHAGRGTMKELELCQEVARVDRVVAVLPETFGDHPFPYLDDEGVIRTLLRVVHLNELDLVDPLATFAWHDLVDRMLAIAQLSIEDRLALLENRSMDAHVPVSFDGVAAGYVRFAQSYRRAGHHLGAVLA